MPQRIFLLIVVQLFLFNGEILGQNKNVEKIPPASTKLRGYEIDQHPKNYFKAIDIPISGQLLFNGFTLKKNYLSPPLPKDFYSNHLGFFCRTELQFEKTTSIPLRFRLGSLAYTDYLENKPNAKAF